MFIKRLSIIASLTVLAFSPIQEAAANSKNSDDKVKSTSKLDDAGDQAERALHAANVLGELMNTPESKIPPELLERAHAVAVIPNLVKAAMGISGMHGKGLVARRTPKGWEAPAFIDFTGGSFGFQIGVSATDLVLVFTREDGLKGLLEDKLELGGEAGVAAGPVGRAAEAGTNVTFDSPIYSYSRSKGLFAGIALKGAVMTIDDSANHKVYGDDVSGKDILIRGAVSPTRVVQPFLQALNRSERRAEAVTRAAREERHRESRSSETAKAVTPNDNIKKAQEALRDKGYEPGPSDGLWGPRTKAALRKYQESQNLPVTGRLDAETAAKLGVEPE
jgi:lipid-binding SYLF domain-containing protein